MLVYLSNPMGYSKICGKRIYGRRYAYGSFPPANITYKDYQGNASQLEVVPYTKNYLVKRFGGEFPDVSFKWPHDLAAAHFDDLIRIAKGIGIDYRRPREYNWEVKIGLAKAIFHLLEEI